MPYVLLAIVVLAALAFGSMFIGDGKWETGDGSELMSGCLFVVFGGSAVVLLIGSIVYAVFFK